MPLATKAAALSGVLRQRAATAELPISANAGTLFCFFVNQFHTVISNVPYDTTAAAADDDNKVINLPTN